MNNPISNTKTSQNAPTDVDSVRLGEAWKWVLRLREDSVDQDDLAAWLRWYEADARNKDAFEDMQSFWQQAERVVEEPNPLAPELWLGELAKPHRPNASAARMRARPASGRGPTAARRRRKFFLAGAVLAAAFYGLFLVSGWMPGLIRNPAAKVEAETASVPPPPVEEAHLPDGSRVELAPKSQVAVLYDDKQRLLEMQKGEAFFKVAHNRERPFVVKVGNINVRAVGTAFNIRSAAGRVVVTVTEGTVDVYPTAAKSKAQAHGEPPADSIRVKAGSEVVWAPNAPGPVIASIDTSHALSWRQGRLDYINEPLSAAIADINRYSNRRIIVRDDAVGKIVFSGTVLANSTDTWIRALPTLFPIDLQTNEAGDVVLASRTLAGRDRSDELKAQ